MKNTRIKDEEYTLSNKACETTHEALKSEPAKRVMELTLKKIGYPEKDSSRMLKIFDDVINDNDVEDIDIMFFKTIIDGDDFTENYDLVKKKISFKDISIEEMQILLEKISLGKVKFLLTKLIIKARMKRVLPLDVIENKAESGSNSLSGAIPEQNTEKGTHEAGKIDKRFEGYKFIEIDGKVYEDLGSNCYKTALDEDVKIYRYLNSEMHEIKGVNNPENIRQAEAGIKGMEEIVVLSEGTGDFKMIRALHSHKIDKTLNIEGSWTMLIIDKDKKMVQLDRKGRIFIGEFHNSFLVDLNLMEIAAYNIAHSFDFAGKEYFIYIDKWGSGGTTSRVYCQDGSYSAKLEGAKKLTDLQIDDRRGTITWGGVMGFRSKTIKLK